MKVKQVMEILAKYDSDEELMISWTDRENFHYLYEEELPLQIWESAVYSYDRGSDQEFMEECHHIVVITKEKYEKEEVA